MKKNKQISTKQIRGLVVATTVGIGIVSLPQRLVQIIENDGWIAILLGGLLLIPVIIAINKIFELYPDKDISEITKEVFGETIVNILLVMILIYLIAAMGFGTRHLGELTKAFLLENTPTEVIIISFILCTSYIARCNIEVIGRATYHIYPLILTYVIVLFILSFKGLDFTNMLPAFQSNIKDMPNAVMTSLYSFTGFEILLFVIPYAEEKEKTLRASLSGFGIVIAIYILLFIISISQFGVYSLKRQTFAVISIVKEIDLPGYFIENLDLFVMAIWVLIVFCTVATQYYISGRVASGLFNTKNHDLFIIPLAPFIYMASIAPKNMFQLEEVLGRFTSYMEIIILIVLPILTYILGYYKIRRGKKSKE